MTNNCQETRTITDVQESEDWFEISQDGMCCGLKKKYGVTPKVGDKLTVHTKGGTFGTIRGMDLNGKRIFWKTDEELEQERLEWLANNEREKKDRFEKNKAQMDADYEALPDAFKKRIDRFRENNPDFRVEFESYELFCCMEAVKIADACKTPEKVQEFKSLNWDEQMKMVEGLSDGHSGNTFGCAVALAYWYLSDENNVSKMHGSLSPLVGSKAFGDVPL